MRNIDCNIQNVKGITAVMEAAQVGNTKALKLLIYKPGIDWSKENNEGDTALDMILRKKQVFEAVVDEVKSTVSQKMTRKFADREITKTPLIFALENDLEEHFIKVLIAGAKTQDIVDLVLHSVSCSPTAVISVDREYNPRKKIKLDNFLII